MPDTAFTDKDFERLFKEYFKPLVNFANKFLNDIDAAKEIVHDAFVRLWERRAEIDVNKSVKSYIYRSVQNRCLNYIRDHKKFVQSEENDQYGKTVPVDTIDAI